MTSRGRLALSIAALLAVMWLGRNLQWTEALAAGGATNRPVPAAFEIEAAETIPTKNLWEIVRDGGVLMVPLAVCSLVLVAVLFERLTALRRDRVIPMAFVTRFLRQVRRGELDVKSAIDLCERDKSGVAQVFAGALRKAGRPAVEVEQGIIDAGERVVNHLRKNLRVIHGVATVAPLLGLLGTVVGMIRAFNAVATADAMGRPELLAGGISQALLTTAAGLCVAIPALIGHMALLGQVDRLIVEMDKHGQELVHIISGDPTSQGLLRHGAHSLSGPKGSRKTSRQTV